MQIDREVQGVAEAAGGPAPEAASRPPGDTREARAGWRPVAGAVTFALACAAGTAVAFESFGFPGLAVVTGALALALLSAGRRRFQRSGGRQGQVLLGAAALVTPLAAHALARTLGLGRPFAAVPTTVLDWVAGPWFVVQASAALAAGLALRAFRIPFLALPLAAAAWLAVQDLAPVLLGHDPTWAQRVLLSALSGCVFMAAGVAADGRTRGDVAFWLYLPGLLAFTCGLVTWTGASDLALAVVALLHAGLVVASLLLGRRGFAVAGALGMAAAAGRLADDLLEPYAATLAAAGVAVALVALGLGYHLFHARLAGWAHARLPRRVARLLPPGR